MNTAVNPVSITIDTNSFPFVPSDLSLQGRSARHRGMGTVTIEKRADGQLYLNGEKIERHLLPEQKDGSSIQGYALAKALKDEPTLNARILDALYENQQLIPNDWEDGATYFWATKFSHAEGNLCVGYLHRPDGRWLRNYRWLAYALYADDYIARLAKK